MHVRCLPDTSCSKLRLRERNFPSRASGSHLCKDSSCYGIRISRVGELLQWVLAPLVWGPEFYPPNPHKKPDTKMQTHYLTTPAAREGAETGELPRSPRASRVEHRSKRDCLSKMQKRTLLAQCCPLISARSTLLPSLHPPAAPSTPCYQSASIPKNIQNPCSPMVYILM